jgi:protoporphyrinogen oxidase
LPDRVVVGADPAGVVAALELAVNHHDRDVRRLEGRERRGRGLDGSTTDDDAIDLLRDQVFDAGGELGDVAAAIGDEDLDVRVVLRFVLDHIRHADEVGAAEG